MKYFLFNIIVVAALVYLFVGGGPSDPVEAWLPENVNDVISDVRERLSADTDDDAATPEISSDHGGRTAESTATVSAAKPDGSPTPMPSVVSAGPAQARTIVASKDTVTAPSIEVPERFAPPAILPVAGRQVAPARSSIVQAAPTQAPTTQVSVSATNPEVEGPMMSARERRRELQRLAEAMELFAVEKSSR